MFAITKNEQRLSGEYRLLREACLAAWREADTNPGVYSVLDMPTGKRAALVLAAHELRDMGFFAYRPEKVQSSNIG